MFGCLYLQLFVSCLIYVTGICVCFWIVVFNTYCVMSYLRYRYLWLLLNSGVQHILCCVFVLVFFVLCILCYQFLWIVYYWFAPSVFSNVYFVLCILCYQFLWIVHSWLLLRCSLTFIFFCTTDTTNIA